MLLFPILDRYPGGLPANYLHALMGEAGGNVAYFCDRRPKLACKPDGYLIRPPSQRENADANYRFQVYDRADRELSKTFWHDLMTNMIVAQIEIGARAGFQFADFGRILPKAPPSSPEPPTRDAAHPATIIIKFTPPGGKERSFSITADHPPFAIGKSGKFKFYFVSETDCGSEILRARTFHRSSIRRKIHLCLAALEQRAVEKIFGIPGPVYFPFVFDEASRIKSTIEIINELTDNQGSPYILLNQFPSYNSFEKPPVADGSSARGGSGPGTPTSAWMIYRRRG